MNELINKFEEQTLKGQFMVEHPDNKNEYDNIDFYYISSIKMSYYQLLSIFDVEPNIYNNTHYKYEWIITSDDSKYFFKIHDIKSSDKLKDIYIWHISSNTLNKEIIHDFMINLNNAIKCYETYYKQIEQGIFDHPDASVSLFLRENKKQLKQKIQLFQTL